MILALLAASVFGLALLMQDLYENDPGFRAWFEPETPEPPPYYADYAYEPLGGRPIRVSLNRCRVQSAARHRHAHHARARW